MYIKAHPAGSRHIHPECVYKTLTEGGGHDQKISGIAADGGVFVVPACGRCGGRNQGGHRPPGERKIPAAPARHRRPADSGGNTTIGGSPHADNAVVPEFDISYFFSDHVAMELILVTSPHDLTLKDRPNGARDLDLGDTWILPPTLTLQYHFQPDEQFSPYIGAGINYTLPYAEDNGADTVDLSADGSFGWALQAGADYWLDSHWGLNADVKKVWVDVDASINSGAITGEVELDPWIVGLGVSYRF